jgi:hypothetical protein
MTAVGGKRTLATPHFDSKKENGGTMAAVRLLVASVVAMRRSFSCAALQLHPQGRLQTVTM